MFKVLPALEAYAIANIATQNLVGGSPLQFLLGDLNTTAGTGFGAVMGPQPGVLTLKELITGEYNYGLLANPGGLPGAMSPTGGGSTFAGGTGYGSGAGTPLEIISANFSSNFGNIIIGSALTTAGFRIAGKVLSKPRNKMNKLIRQVGLGSTIQL